MSLVTSVRMMFLLMIVAVVASSVMAEVTPLLYEIKVKDDDSSYILGTMHYPDRRITELPDYVYEIFENCDTYILEADIGDPAAQMAIAQYMMLPDTLTLKKTLPEDLYVEIEKVLAEMGQSIEMFQMMKPWAITLILSMPPSKDSIPPTPMDLDFYQRAQKGGLDIIGLETLEDQVKVFDDYSFEEQAKLLRKTLDEYKSYEEHLGKLIEFYQEGDLGKLSNYMNEWSVTEEDKEFMGKILDDRNKKMYNGIVDNLEKAGNNFIAVGAAHLGGDNGILKMLEDKGYKIERVKK